MDMSAYLSKSKFLKNQMEDIVETHELHENDYELDFKHLNNLKLNEFDPDRLLDDSFGTGLEFSRLI